MSDRPLVWLPFDPELLGGRPPELRYEQIDSPNPAHDSAGQVRFLVAPYGRRVDWPNLLPALTALEVVQSISAGVDGIRPYLPPSVRLSNGRGVQDPATADLAVALLLASLRGLPRFIRQQDRGEWAGTDDLVPTVGRLILLGYGAIGQAIEARLLPFGFDIVRVARTARADIHGFDELSELLPAADAIVVALPLTGETRGLVDAALLALLPAGALVVNIARGSVVVTDDMVAALRSGRIRYATDVADPEPLPPDHALWTAPNVMITPHVGSATDRLWPRAYRLVCDQLRRYAGGHPLLNVIEGEY